MRALLSILLTGLSFFSYGQSYDDSLMAHREHYRDEFLTDSRSPLKAEDTSFLRFFPPDISYRVFARVVPTQDTQKFDMHTYSGKVRPYRKYADLHFTLNNRPLRLEIYQSLDLLKKEEYKDHLFLPFKDLTNYESTYGGGRYIDLSLKDIDNDFIELDFNKAYNPWCAFASGYSCPIPPDANKLDTPIPVGEKLYGKEHTE